MFRWCIFSSTIQPCIYGVLLSWKVSLFILHDCISWKILSFNINKSNRLPVFPGFYSYDGNWSQSAVFLWFPFWHVLLMLGHLHLLDFSPLTPLHWHISMETIYFLHGHAHYKYCMQIFMKDIFFLIFYFEKVVIVRVCLWLSRLCPQAEEKKGDVLLIKSCNENCSVTHRQSLEQGKMFPP